MPKREFEQPIFLDNSTSPIHRGPDEALSNLNLARNNQFILTFHKLPHLEFFVKQVIIPEISLGSPKQSTPFKDIPRFGDTMEFGRLDTTIFIDENFENYFEIQRWMRSIGTPESFKENIAREVEKNNLVSTSNDATLSVFSNGGNECIQFHFHDIFPVHIGSIELRTGVQNSSNLEVQVSYEFSNFVVNVLPQGYDSQ